MVEISEKEIKELLYRIANARQLYVDEIVERTKFKMACKELMENNKK